MSTETNQVYVYLTEREIDGSRYGEEICARSWEEAEAIAAKIGSKVLGTSVEQACDGCGAILRQGAPPKDNDDVLNAEEVG